jgi:hypothetical protein
MFPMSELSKPPRVVVGTPEDESTMPLMERTTSATSAAFLSCATSLSARFLWVRGGLDQLVEPLVLFGRGGALLLGREVEDGAGLGVVLAVRLELTLGVGGHVR